MDYTFDSAGIAAQRAVCDAATVAPWSWGGDVLTSHWTNVISVYDNEGGASFSLEIDETDRTFIALSRTAYPAALTEIERLLPFEAEAAALRAQVASLTRERDADKETIRLLEGDKYNSELNLQTLVEQLDAEKKRTDEAISDLKYLSGEYKLCDTCKRNHGKGVWDCNDGLCDKENHYEWRGPCAENAHEGAESEGH